MIFGIRVMQKPAFAVCQLANLDIAAVNPWFTHLIKNYGSWTSRTPSAIVNKKELLENPDADVNKAFRIPRKRRGKGVKVDSKQVDVESNYTNYGSQFNITEPSKQLVSKLMIKARQRNNKENIIMLEGIRLIRDSIKAGVKPRALFFSKKTSKILESLDLPKEIELYQIPYKDIETWSTLATPPGIIGVFEKPDLSKIQPAFDAIPLTVICDNIKDPRNLGMIIRTAAAVGCERLILLKGCTDLWNSMVQRCAAAAQFQLPIDSNTTWSDVSKIVNPDAKFYIADSNTSSTFDEIEAEYELKETQIKTEDQEDVESNASGHTEESLNDELKTAEASEDSTELRNSDETVPVKSTSLHADQQKRALKNFIAQLPINICYFIDYTQNENVLIVSGETEGFSLGLHKFLLGKKGTRLHVPLSNNVDSLGSPMALGILLYEIRRQYLMKGD